MKITDPDIIKNGEKNLIEAVRDDLDIDAVKDVLKKKMAAAALSSKGGEIVVHNNEIAFRLDFDIHLSSSLMFDRQGNYILESDEDSDATPDESGDQENLISEDFDLEDINMTETLEEVGPQTLLDDSEDSEIETDDLIPDDIIDDDIIDDDIVDDDIVDDDIGDILEESSEFWEPKKD